MASVVYQHHQHNNLFVSFRLPCDGRHYWLDKTLVTTNDGAKYSARNRLPYAVMYALDGRKHACILAAVHAPSSSSLLLPQSFGRQSAELMHRKHVRAGVWCTDSAPHCNHSRSQRRAFRGKFDSNTAVPLAHLCNCVVFLAGWLSAAFCCLRWRFKVPGKWGSMPNTDRPTDRETVCPFVRPFVLSYTKTSTHSTHSLSLGAASRPTLI